MISKAIKMGQLSRRFTRTSKVTTAAVICPFIGGAMLSNLFIGIPTAFDGLEINKVDLQYGKCAVLAGCYMAIAMGLNHQPGNIAKIGLITGVAVGALAADYPKTNNSRYLVHYCVKSKPERQQKPKI